MTYAFVRIETHVGMIQIKGQENLETYFKIAKMFLEYVEEEIMKEKEEKEAKK